MTDPTDRHRDALRVRALIQSGYAGVTREGTIVDLLTAIPPGCPNPES